MKSGINQLESLTQRLKSPRGDQEQDYQQHVLAFAGALREFAVASAETPLPESDVAALDRAVGQLSDELQLLYAEGRAGAKDVAKDLAAKLAEASGATADGLKREQLRLSNYARLDFEQIAEYMRFCLDQRE